MKKLSIITRSSTRTTFNAPKSHGDNYNFNEPVMEGVVFDAESLEELEGDTKTALGVVERIGAVVPRALQGREAKGIPSRSTESMPVYHGETQPVFHRPPVDQLIQGQGLFGYGSYGRAIP